MDLDTDSLAIEHGWFSGSGALTSKMISPMTAVWWSIICYALCITLAFATNLLVGYIMLFSVFISVTYSVPPTRTRARTPWHLFAEAVGIGMMTFLIGYASATGGLTYNSLWFSILPAFGHICWFAKDMPDMEPDRMAGLRTFPVVHGLKGSAIMFTFAVSTLIALLLIFIGIGFLSPVCAISLVLVLLIPLIITLREFYKNLNVEYSRKLFMRSVVIEILFPLVLSLLAVLSWVRI